jgi:cephalosporin-C deacetylase-like acetyl esterase
VNFASRVKTPLRGARGLADGVCSPSSTKLIFDAVASKEKYVIDCPGMTHKVFPEIEADLNAWVRSRLLRVDQSAKSASGKSAKVSGEFHETGGR